MFCVLMDCDQNMEQGIGATVDQFDRDHDKHVVDVQLFWFGNNISDN